MKDLGDRLTLAQGDVDKSVRHARNLTKLSDKLNKEIKGTKDFANTSLRAAYVYKIIVDAIYEALRAAQMANSTAYEAKQKVNVRISSQFHYFLLSVFLFADCTDNTSFSFP